MITRITQLQKKLTATQACLLSQAGDVSYFSSFHFLVPAEREAMLLICKQQAFLFHGRFCPVSKLTGVTNVIASTPVQIAQEISQLRSQHRFTTLMVDKSSLFVEEYEALDALPELKLTALDRQLIWKLRMVKNNQEIEHCRQAAQIAARSFAALAKAIVPGVTERALQLELEQLMIQHGSEAPAFPTIVAFGDHTALPHHQPTDRPLTANTAILIDFGATINGYRSDMTRSWWFGNQPDEEFVMLEQTVQAAYQATLKTMARGKTVTARELDQAARELITAAHYGDYFIHTTGHGVGLDIHEPPSLSYRTETELIPGMVITVEPGIYLEGKFGYRHENTVLVTPSGPAELTS